jgi:hypothetical protein
VAGNSITIEANPIPDIGDQCLVTYIYAPDFGEYVIALRDRLEE